MVSLRSLITVEIEKNFAIIIFSTKYFLTGYTMSERTNREKERRNIEAVGWTIVWRDFINEWDVIALIASIPTGTVGSWISQQPKS
jgi:hypothetical protein